MATFKAKARAVELLGKGQIADLPTAITELWKNGYDAYAKNLTCKLFLDSYKDNQRPIFLLSDDGFGMSESDILNRWFVLGTDSKARGQRIQPHFGLKERTPMGEKGIGRLSVSYLGSQMLMLSKKEGEKANAMIMDWRILDNYDFFLEDLNIPLFSFDTIKEFNSELSKAKKTFQGNLKKEKWEDQKEYREDIIRDWNSFDLPDFIEEELISKFCDVNYHCTTFITLTPHDQILELSDKDRIELKGDSSLTYLRASLSGLHNDLKDPDKDFETHFLIYDASGKYDLIDDFFTQKEMRNADHWLKGEFDENGFFSGEIKVFNKREKYTFRPNRPPGKTTYGPFAIEWGSVEGNISSSQLNNEQYRIIDEKLETFGGLYIYRDDFRVLPYGRTEADFLEFEKRRSLGAGYYFFSHRRFMGYIDLSREKNPTLRDKAGREGFIQNKAYREFRDDLIEFFIDVAKRYMRVDSKNEEYSTYREEQLSEIQSKYKKQSNAAKKKNKKTKKAFLEDLKENTTKIPELLKEIDELEGKITKESEAIEINYNSYNGLISVLEEKKNELRSLKLQKPQNVSVTQRQEKEYHSYQKSYRATEDRVRSCVKIVEKTRERINTENLKLEFNDKFRSHIKFLGKQFSNFQSVSSEGFDRIYKSLGEEKDVQIDLFKIQSEPLKLNTSDTKEDITAKIKNLESIIEEQKITIQESFGGFITHVSNLQIDVDDDFLRSWYEKQNIELEKRIQDYEELAQLGMSIEIIDHQFNVMYSQMNDAINEIDQFARKNKEIDFSFKQLKNAFQHMEGNYKLLKPLYRTSRRVREVIYGHQIEKYIKDFFKNDFKRYRIDFSVNDAFREYDFFSYDSIVKPVFLNIISNANYWLIPVEDRKIRIELEDQEIRIMNSGEPIDDSHLEDVFTIFFTRKRDGRGIGLYLAKKNLQSIGYEIFASNDPTKNKLNGACFIIKKSK
ncbi:ATP-binding protein [Aquimarina sp. BL5]|uniref:ATP-binding protein n=1 Tax=Aquimarina sp. BL5 TaxID=1714860 RepID=UPI000E4C64E0|nr:ATP-binding protein [Aquimarina sp. BL5]AXT51358.1 ATP-binding protein [Aquimarina sp. BL5]RKN09852.1 ATP-binding protein [Aquimarina sp. BL5]